MKVIRQRYYFFLLICMLLLFSFSIGLSIWAISSTVGVHATQTREQIYAIKKTFLKDTVKNVIADIDRIRNLNREAGRARMLHLISDMKLFEKNNSDQFEELAIDILREEGNDPGLNLLLENLATGSVLYRSGELSDYRFGSFLRSGYTELIFGSLHLAIGIDEKWVDTQTKKAIADIIHTQIFVEGQYIWVNEIINWNGGDDYAIRRIHPNLIKTEGIFLSTNMKDIKGNTPYLTELEGVKKSGEVFSTYFFKRLGTDKIAEKLTYATVYKDYDWIIAMGTYLEDVQVYIDAAQTASRSLTIQIILTVALLTGLLFLIGVFVLSQMERWYLQTSSDAVREESNHDALTGALNRRMCDQYLQDSFRRYQRKLENPVLLSFDLDNFKKVNDTWGHDAGDLVLKAVVSEVMVNMRNTDRLFRWGGEEFLLLCYGVDEDAALSLAEKFNRTIALTPIVIGKTDDTPTCDYDLETCAYIACDLPDRFQHLCIDRDGNKIIHVSISIGVTWFLPGDTGPETAMKRADGALYLAKADGKNCSRLGLHS